MQIAAVLARQILIMFMLMGVGFTLCKTKKITPEGCKAMANLLVFAIIPSVMLKGFQVERSVENVRAMVSGMLLSVSALALSTLISRLIFKKSPIDNFSAAFSNAGFIGIPLVQAALGDSAVFYISIFIALLNVLQWTYGVSVMTGKNPLAQLKSLLVNPIILAFVFGLFMFFTDTTLPPIVNRVVDYLAVMNAPVAMMVLGVYLGNVDWKRMLTASRLYLCAAVRLLLIPAAMMLIFKIIPAEPAVRLAIFISASAPVGVNAAVYAQIHGKDHSYAVQTVTLSTLLSIAALPCMVELACFLWGM